MKNMVAKIKGLWSREIREIAASISKEGVDDKEIESKGYAGGIRAKDFPSGQIPPDFGPSTVILNDGYGIWELNIPEDVLKNSIDMTLKIETVRTHGMLHTPRFDRSEGARQYVKIFVNGELVDKISMVKPHPHGEDFGVDSRRSFPVFSYIDRNRSAQMVRIEVDDEVLWNIDRIVLEPVTLK
jgi:hypothetical protein